MADVLPQSAYQQRFAAPVRAPNMTISTILQTTIPTARLSNAGRSSQTQRIRIDGQNRRHHADGAARGQREPVALKIEDGQAYGRQGNGDEWSPLEQPRLTSCPRFMTCMAFCGHGECARSRPQRPRHGRYLRAGRAGAWRAMGADIGIDRYAFDLSGPRFAAFMKAQMEEQLAPQRRIAPSVSLSMPNQYVGMTGQGEPSPMTPVCPRAC
ncbi:MAG: hypothetical protein R2932_60190 [Caldilineaceae bacterium]